MRVVVALGGRALPTARTERATVRRACRALAPLARQHELVVCHGNGPQAKLEPLIHQELGSELPVTYTDERRLSGVEVAVDRDLAAALVAIDLRADVLLSITDVDAVYADWETAQARPIRRATPTALAARKFAGESMGPKVRAACSFVEQTGGMAAIGSMRHAGALLACEAGTIVSLEGALYAA